VDLPSNLPNVPAPGSDLASVKDALAKGSAAHFLDVSNGRLSPADVTAIEQKVSNLQSQTGAKVFVVSLPPKTDVESYRPIYKDLGMKGKDILVVFNGERRHLHCQAITKQAGNDILKKTKDEFYKSNVTGLGTMLDECSRLIGPKAAATSLPGAPSGSAGPGANAGKGGLATELILVVIALGILGWVFVRRRQREAALAANLKDALGPAESAVTDTLEALEDRERTDEVKRVRDRANALKKDIADVKRMPIDHPAVARARTLRSEAKKLRRDLAALDEPKKVEHTDDA